MYNSQLLHLPAIMANLRNLTPALISAGRNALGVFVSDHLLESVSADVGSNTDLLALSLCLLFVSESLHSWKPDVQTPANKRVVKLLQNIGKLVSSTMIYVIVQVSVNVISRVLTSSTNSAWYGAAVSIFLYAVVEAAVSDKDDIEFAPHYG